MATNSPSAVDSCGAVESAKDDWQNGKTYRIYERSYI